MKRLILFGVFVLLLVSGVSADTGYVEGEFNTETFRLTIDGGLLDGEEFPFNEWLDDCVVITENLEILSNTENLAECKISAEGELEVHFLIDEFSVILYSTDVVLGSGSQLSYNLLDDNAIDFNLGGTATIVLSDIVFSSEQEGEFTFWVEEREGESLDKILSFEIDEAIVIETFDVFASLIVNGYYLSPDGDARIEYIDNDLKVILNYQEEECLSEQAEGLYLYYEDAANYLDISTKDLTEREYYAIGQNMCNTEVYLMNNDKTFYYVMDGEDKVIAPIKIVSNANNNDINFAVQRKGGKEFAWVNFLLSNEDELNLVFTDGAYSSVIVNEDDAHRSQLQVCDKSFNLQDGTTLGKNTKVWFDIDVIEPETTGEMPKIDCDFYSAKFEFNEESAEGGYDLSFVKAYPKFVISDTNSLGPHTTGGDYVLSVLRTVSEEGYQGWWSADGGFGNSGTSGFLSIFGKDRGSSDSGFEIVLSEDVTVKGLEGFKFLDYNDKGHYGVSAESFRIGNVGFVPNGGMAYVYLGTEDFNVQGIDMTGAVVSEVENDRVISFFSDLTDMITGRAVDNWDDTEGLEDELGEIGADEGDIEIEDKIEGDGSVGYVRGEIGDIQFADYSGGRGEDRDLTDFGGGDFVALSDISSLNGEEFIGALDSSMYLIGEDVTVNMPQGGHVYNYETGNKYVLKEGIYNLYVRNSNLELIDCCSGETTLAANLDNGVYHVGCVSGKGRYDRYNQFTESVGTYRLDTSSVCTFAVEDEDALVSVVGGEQGDKKVDAELDEEELKEEVLSGCAAKGDGWGCNCVRRTVDPDGKCVAKGKLQGLWVASECDSTDSCDSTPSLCLGYQTYCCNEDARGINGAAHKQGIAYAFYTNTDGHEFTCGGTDRVIEPEGIVGVIPPVVDAVDFIVDAGTIIGDDDNFCEFDYECAAGGVCVRGVCVKDTTEADFIVDAGTIIGDDEEDGEADVTICIDDSDCEVGSCVQGSCTEIVFGDAEDEEDADATTATEKTCIFIDAQWPWPNLYFKYEGNNWHMKKGQGEWIEITSGFNSNVAESYFDLNVEEASIAEYLVNSDLDGGNSLIANQYGNQASYDESSCTLA